MVKYGSHTFRDAQWVTTRSAYLLLQEQGYVTHTIEKRAATDGTLVTWRLMVLP